ncbi:hypothetical protein [Microbacterium foliorum]|uniref:hypothetical protein n=1 Tax=Microbacterium foliorum TaxID=104336 RepID=UPI0028D1B8F8|nr:hypothetical protein [Microbacterium foliorum]
MNFTLDPALVIQLLVSTILPLLVGLVTKTITRPGVKAVLLALLSLVTSLLVELGAAVTAATTYDVGRGLLLALPTFLIAVGLHYGLWKPVGAAEKLQEIGSPDATPDRPTHVTQTNYFATDQASAQHAVDRLRGDRGSV